MVKNQEKMLHLYNHYHKTEWLFSKDKFDHSSFPSKRSHDFLLQLLPNLHSSPWLRGPRLPWTLPTCTSPACTTGSLASSASITQVSPLFLKSTQPAPGLYVPRFLCWAALLRLSPGLSLSHALGLISNISSSMMSSLIILHKAGPLSLSLSISFPSLFTLWHILL